MILGRDAGDATDPRSWLIMGDFYEWKFGDSATKEDGVRRDLGNVEFSVFHEGRRAGKTDPGGGVMI
jgi:hypothetical protein